MKKRRVAGLILLVLIMAAIVPTLASGMRYPEPEGRQTIATQEGTTGTGYGTSADGETLNANDVWYAEHKSSDNVIDKAILESIELLRVKPINEDEGWSSVPKDAHDMSEIVSCMGKLDYNSLAELWERTCTESGWRAQKIAGLELLLSIRTENNLCGSMMYDIWYAQFCELKNCVARAPSDEQNVKNFGYLAIPVLIDRWENDRTAQAEAALLAAINEVCPGTEDIGSWTAQNTDFVAALRFVLNTDFRWVSE